MLSLMFKPMPIIQKFRLNSKRPRLNNILTTKLGLLSSSQLTENKSNNYLYQSNMHNIGKKEFFAALAMAVLHSVFSLFVILSSIWLCLALWFQEPFGWLITRLLIGIWIVFALSIL